MNAESAAGHRPVRVLHLRDSPWVDGPGRTILETAIRIDRSRVDYHVGAFVSNHNQPHPLIKALEQRGLPVHLINDRAGVGQRIVDEIIGLIDQLHIDILHTSEFRSNVLALLCRRRRAIRIVSTAHGWIENDLRGSAYAFADRALLRYFDRVILVSHAMRRRLPAWWVPDARVSVLHNALMTGTYGRDLSITRRRPSRLGSEIRLLNVGRLSPEKGQDLLLRAVAKLIKEFPSLRLWFAGVGPMQESLDGLARRLGIGSHVRFLGYIADMPSLYRDIDVVVQSSLTEGLPNVMLEVAYLGVPVVATDVGGTSEVIEHGVSGWLIEAGSVESIQEGVRRYLEDTSAFEKMASRGRARIEQMFSIDERTEQQALIYRDVACIPR